MEIKIPDKLGDLVEFVDALKQDNKSRYVSLYYYTEEDLQDLMNDPKFHLLAIYDKNKIVALTRVKNESHNYGIDHYAELTLAVHPKYRRKGLAKKLVEENFKRLSHVRVIMAEVVDDHKEGISFLEKLGFKRMGTDPKKVKIDGKYHDFHRYFLIKNL